MPFFSLLNWLHLVTLNTFVRVQGSSKSIDINIYSTMSLLFLLLSFTLTIVSSFVSLICQRSMSDLSLHADLFFSQLFHIPLCPRHHSSPNLSWHLCFCFFPFPWTVSKTAPSPATMWLCRVTAAAWDLFACLFVDVLNDLLLLPVALCSCVCCCAPCYAKVNVRMLMLSRYKGLSLCHIIPWGFFFFFCTVQKLLMSVTIDVWM